MVFVFLADGFEDMEAVVPFDLMKRAGIEAVTVGTGGKNIESAHGLSVTAKIDESEVDFSVAEAFVFPGGWPGAKNLKNSETVNNAVKFALDNDIIIGAICASPGYVLSGTGALLGKNYTCFPGFEAEEGNYTANDIEIDGKLITANGPQSAVKFGLALVKAIKGDTEELSAFY